MWHAVRIEDGRILFSHEDKSTVTAWIDRHHCWFFVQVERTGAAPAVKPVRYFG